MECETAYVWRFPVVKMCAVTGMVVKILLRSGSFAASGRGRLEPGGFIAQSRELSFSGTCKRSATNELHRESFHCGSLSSAGGFWVAIPAVPCTIPSPTNSCDDLQPTGTPLAPLRHAGPDGPGESENPRPGWPGDSCGRKVGMAGIEHGEFLQMLCRVHRDVGAALTRGQRGEILAASVGRPTACTL